MVRILCLLVAAAMLAGCTNTRVEAVRAADIPSDFRAGRVLVFAGSFPDDARAPFETAFAERLRAAGVDAVGALEAAVQIAKGAASDEIQRVAGNGGYSSVLHMNGYSARTETRTVYVSQTLYGFTSFRPEQRVFGPFYSYRVALIDVPRWRTVWTASANGTKAGLASMEKFGREAADTAVEQMIDDRVIVPKG
ncbi:hypothetical protein [Thalassobaculum sp.]|uniref:hypothetical protein n=1 Tax=Thalassobaculum sp. TaxID=2022740 RepID=UPI0032EDD8AF